MVTGKSSGQVTCQKRCHGRAPSIAAASCSSGLMVCSPASRLIAKNGTPRQTLTMMTEISARVGIAQPIDPAVDQAELEQASS